MHWIMPLAGLVVFGTATIVTIESIAMALEGRRFSTRLLLIALTAGCVTAGMGLYIASD